MRNDFSKQSRRAIVIFSVLFLLIVLFPRVYLYFQTPTTFSVEEILVPSEKQNPDQKNKWKSFREKSAQKKSRKHSFQVPPSRFDPNNYTVEDWMKIGLSEKQAQTVLKFNKYGFRSVQDMEKCFIFQNEALMEAISDSLFFPEKPKKESFEKEHILLTTPINLNTASKEELLKLKGIGEFYANKIIEYRERLGGFYRTEQLLELYKFDQEKLKMISPLIYIRLNDVKKINLNEVEAATLKQHPYIRNWNLANSIVKIRLQKGRYQAIGEIKESKLMTEEMYNKLKPYLTVEEE